MAVHAIAFNADGTLVASGGLDGTVRIWNAPDGKEIRRFQDPSGVLSVAFSGDGRLVAGGTINGDLRVWALRSGKQVLELKPGGPVVDAAFSPDGRAIATASRKGSARIWEVASGRLRMDLPVGEANAISFSPDGHLLATASSDGQARLFALRREDLIAQTCARLPRDLTIKERKEWLSDMPHGQPCPLLASTAPAPEDASARSPSGGLTGKAATFVLHAEEAQSRGSPGASLVEEAVRLARGGSILDSLKTVAMIETNKDLGVTLSADDWNALCWHGASHGQAKDVISACDNAVEAARKKGSRLPPDFYRDSRAVARAVIGDKEGAIADFVAYLDWCKRSRCGPQTSRRELWVRELRSGRNPFDEATLASLRDE
jgi:hypothetical protein